MTTAVDPKDRTLVLALAAYAARDGLGETLPLEDVPAAVWALQDDAVGPRDLRAVMTRLNDPAVAATLEDWFIRAAAEREEDAQAAARAAERLLAPLQIATMGGGAASAAAIAAGTAVLAAALIVAAAASFGRWRLAKREDEAKADAAAIRRLAEIARRAQT